MPSILRVGADASKAGRFVYDCPPRAFAEYIVRGNSFTSPAVTITHAGVKDEGKPFAFIATSKEAAEKEFVRELRKYTKGRVWGYRRAPMTMEIDGGYTCTARVFLFDPATEASEVEIVPDER